MKKNKKAFTLIELIAVLVIMAIIALIVTPLVMNIVKKAKDSANKRSVDGYGKAVELAVATYLLDTGDYPTSLDNLTVEYTGNEVVCNVKTLNEDGSVYLSECSVKGTEVKDSSTEDGWYHYGKLNLKSITYQTYTIGDTVTYNGMNFYVIEDSDEKSDRVTMLKAEPLTVDEVNTYGVGHINNYIFGSVGTASNYGGYGGMAYYSSSTCGYNGSSFVYDECTTDYDDSEVKYVVDAWATDKISNGVLVEDETGYSARLLTLEDLINNLGHIKRDGATSVNYDLTEDTPSWVYSKSYSYWTMSAYEDSASYVWLVVSGGTYADNCTVGSFCGAVDDRSVDDNSQVIRPVVTLKKSAI